MVEVPISNQVSFFPQVSRRSWAGNEKALRTIKRAMEFNDNLKVTLPNPVCPDIGSLIEGLVTSHADKN